MGESVWSMLNGKWQDFRNEVLPADFLEAVGKELGTWAGPC